MPVTAAQEHELLIAGGILAVDAKNDDVDDPLIELELDKTTLEIPTTHAGEVLVVHVGAGDSIEEGDLIATLRPA